MFFVYNENMFMSHYCVPFDTYKYTMQTIQEIDYYKFKT